MPATMGHLSKKNLKQYLASKNAPAIKVAKVDGNAPNRTKKSVKNRATPKASSLKARRVRKQLSGVRKSF